MDVYVQSTIGACSEFVVDGKKKEIAIVISPLKLVQDEKNEKNLKVNSGCNMWRACQNAECQFSLLNRGGEGK